MNTKDRKVTKVVEEIGRINFSGNVIPSSWFQVPELRLPSGLAYQLAINLLADLVYWYRPVEVVDENSNQLVRYERKFETDKLRIFYPAWAKKFGVTKRMVQDAVAHLRRRGLITLELREIKLGSAVLNNVPHIEPMPSRIRDITFSSFTQADINKPESGYIYIVDTGDRLYKIGNCYDLDRRKKVRSQTGEEPRIIVSWFTPDRHKAESALHAKFKDKRKAKTEVFELDREDLEYLLTQATLDPLPSGRDTPLSRQNGTPSPGRTRQPLPSGRDTYIDNTVPEITTQITHTDARARAEAIRVSESAGSKFSLEICRRYAEHLKATRQGIKYPGGYATMIYRSGEADELIEAWLVEPDTTPIDVKEIAWQERIVREISAIARASFESTAKRLGFAVSSADYDALCTAWELEPSSLAAFREKLLELSASEQLVEFLCGRNGLVADVEERAEVKR